MTTETNTANVLRFIRSFGEDYRRTATTVGVRVIPVGGSRPEYTKVVGIVVADVAECRVAATELEFSLRNYYLSKVASLYLYEVFAVLASGREVTREIPIHLD